jgi:membrane fusion protein, multidrug efflux system
MLVMTDSRFPAVARVAAGFLALLLLAILTACAAPAAQAGDPPATPITAARAVSRPVTEWNEFTGRLEAVHHVDIRPRVSGVVSAVHFTEGALVRQGDVLFQIDPRPFQAEVDRLAAELQRAQATLTRTAAERERAERLVAGNAISAEEHDRRTAAADEAAAEVQAVRAALRAADLNLEFTRVIAPISGRVGQAIVTEGNLVSAGPGVATLLTTLVSLDPIYASFEVDEPTFLTFRQTASTAGEEGPGKLRRTAETGPRLIRLALAGDEGFPREGRVDFVDNQLDPATGTIRVRATFRNSDGALTPGLFVRIQLPGRNSGQGVLVRDEAIGTDLDKRFVYVVGPDHAIAYRPVTLGPIVDGLRVIRSGVAAEDVVVTRGLQRVRPGVKVAATLEGMEAAR